jgi:hypothetical protein
MSSDDTSLWYISFASDEGFLGATVVRAPDPSSAVARATQLGINPGGEAALFQVPMGDDAMVMLNRLVPYEELKAGGGKKLSEMSPEERADFADFADRICEECNTGKLH